MIRITPLGLFWRALFAILFCVATYNGSEYNAYQLVITQWETSTYPVLFLVAVWLICAITLGWIVYDTLGKIGIIMLLGLAVVSIAWARDAGIVDPLQPSFWQWAGPSIVGAILAAGLIGGYCYRWLTGRVMVDDADT